jgi:hypothetical protein
MGNRLLCGLQPVLVLKEADVDRLSRQWNTKTGRGSLAVAQLCCETLSHFIGILDRNARRMILCLRTNLTQ